MTKTTRTKRRRLDAEKEDRLKDQLIQAQKEYMIDFAEKHGGFKQVAQDLGSSVQSLYQYASGERKLLLYRAFTMEYYYNERTINYWKYIKKFWVYL